MAMTLLDFGRSYVPKLYALPNHADDRVVKSVDGKSEFVSIGSRQLTFALIPHTEDLPAKGPLNDHVRSCVDAFLGRIANFQTMIDNGLAKPANVKGYVDYWMEVISGERYPARKDVFIALRWHMETYGYDDVKRLARLCGHELVVEEADKRRLREKFKNYRLGTLEPSPPAESEPAASQLGA